MHGGTPRRAVAAALLGLAVATAFAESPARLVRPSLGRPVFVEPGGRFQVVAELPGLQRPPTCRLVSPQFPSFEQRLTLADEDAAALAAGQPVWLTVPQQTPRQTYDLEIESDDARLRARHAVAVRSVADRLRIAHLSNLNLGDPAAPALDPRLIQEINLAAPDLIVATGDFVDVTHPQPGAAWAQLTDAFTRFDAPLLAACGDHDEIEYYTRYVSASPVGALDVGAFRGVVLLDHPARPISHDPDQIAWVERLLNEPNDDRLTFIVTHDQTPSLLYHWHRAGTLERMVRGARLGLWFAGGPTEWNRRQDADLLAAAEPLLFVRTHQSSAAPRAGASGIPHYRIVELNGRRAHVWAPPRPHPDYDAALPLGALTITHAQPNDGTAARLGFVAANNLTQDVTALRQRIILRNPQRDAPWCLGARVVQATQVGLHTVCELQFDLPAKAARRVVIGVDNQPAQPQINVAFNGPHEWPRDAAPRPQLTLTNTGDREAIVQPLIRTAGRTTPYRLAASDGPAATAYKLRLRPGQTLVLELRPDLIDLPAGEHAIHVYVQGGAAWWPETTTIHVR